MIQSFHIIGASLSELRRNGTSLHELYVRYMVLARIVGNYFIIRWDHAYDLLHTTLG